MWWWPSKVYIKPSMIFKVIPEWEILINTVWPSGVTAISSGIEKSSTWRKVQLNLTKGRKMFWEGCQRKVKYEVGVTGVSRVQKNYFWENFLEISFQSHFVGPQTMFYIFGLECFRQIWSYMIVKMVMMNWNTNANTSKSIHCIYTHTF